MDKLIIIRRISLPLYVLGLLIIYTPALIHLDNEKSDTMTAIDICLAVGGFCICLLGCVLYCEANGRINSRKTIIINNPVMGIEIVCDQNPDAQDKPLVNTHNYKIDDSTVVL